MSHDGRVHKDTKENERSQTKVFFPLTGHHLSAHSLTIPYEHKKNQIEIRTHACTNAQTDKIGSRKNKHLHLDSKAASTDST